nr:MAG TPA: hypothetical protein [Caudoviricetes sp.]
MFLNKLLNYVLLFYIFLLAKIFFLSILILIRQPCSFRTWGLAVSL